ncbi:MAG: phytanoyl-CoA dioxygenase family protein [Alphaproteobacteria bacterium]|nr:phytanoyl-CoA dioxygenase family protein [Alphaproteobacteria bacterium]
MSEAQHERYRSDGVLFPVRVMEEAEAAEALSRFERIEAERAGRLPPSLNAKPHLLIPWAWDIVHDPRILDAVDDLLGPDILCWASSFIVKNGHDGRYVAWHQDATYWGLSSPDAVTVWIALTSSTKANGGVRFLTGTHRSARPHIDTGDSRNLLGRRESVDEALDDTGAIDAELKPGEASLHDALILHGSEPNRTDGRRVGFSIRYIPASVRHVGPGRNSATLVRGRDHGGFDLERKPEGEFHPAAMARHRDVLRRAMSTIFDGGEQR